MRTANVSEILERVRKLRFSRRREFFERLLFCARNRAGVPVDWPDVLLFVDDEDWLNAIEVADRGPKLVRP